MPCDFESYNSYKKSMSLRVSSFDISGFDEVLVTLQNKNPSLPIKDPLVSNALIDLVWLDSWAFIDATGHFHHKNRSLGLLS